jgi:hypothetical protein
MIYKNLPAPETPTRADATLHLNFAMKKVPAGDIILVQRQACPTFGGDKSNKNSFNRIRISFFRHPFDRMKNSVHIHRNQGTLNRKIVIGNSVIYSMNYMEKYLVANQRSDTSLNEVRSHAKLTVTSW